MHQWLLYKINKNRCFYFSLFNLGCIIYWLNCLIKAEAVFIVYALIGVISTVSVILNNQHDYYRTIIRGGVLR